jgi:hypothetical protein
MKTTKEPKGLLVLDDANQRAEQFVDVPPDDMRSIRRSILRLD